MATDIKLKLLVAVTAVVGLPLGWYLSTALTERAISVQFVFHRSLAAFLGTVAAGGAVYLWKIKNRSLLALLVLGVGLLAILGMGLWMASGA